jgi:uncharacterized membrane protein YeaQ/YmgE (transglycosylase-associated protein family)
MSVDLPLLSGSIGLEELLLVILVGLVAVFLAGRVVSGHGYGVIGDIVVGVVGALIGAFILGTFVSDHVLVPLRVAAGSLGVRMIVAFIAAAVLLAALHLFAPVVRLGVASQSRRGPGSG